MQQAKYIIVKSPGQMEQAIVFPAALMHRQVKLPNNKMEIVAAGFVRFEVQQYGIKIVPICSGRSESLGVSARREEDAEVINLTLNINERED